MSNEFEDRRLDEAQFDEYLRRGSAVSQHYREISAREVSPALDARVLQLAQQKLASQTSATAPARRRPWVRWGGPLALAASALITLSVLFVPQTREAALPTSAAPVPMALQPDEVAASKTADDASNQASGQALGQAPVDAAARADVRGNAALPQAVPPAQVPQRLMLRSPVPPAAAVAERESAPGAGAAAPSPPAFPGGAQRTSGSVQTPSAAAAPVPSAPPPPAASGDAAETAIAAVPSDPSAMRVTPDLGPRLSAASGAAGSQADKSAAEKRAAAPAAAEAVRIQSVARAREPEQKPQGRDEEAARADAPSSPPEPEVSVEEDRRIVPEIWVSRIRAARGQGRAEDVAALLRRLRAAHPDFKVPRDLESP